MAIGLLHYSVLLNDSKLGSGGTMHECHVKRKPNGFSLIELLIVVAIILIIVAIAIPSFLTSRMSANESSAVSSVRTITTAETTYSTVYPNIGYSVALTDLGEGNGGGPCVASQIQACLIDKVLASGSKAGYKLTYVQDGSSTPSVAYSVNADPISRGSTGRRSFFTNQPGVIRCNLTGVATVNDPPI
jgi:type IV pilus assembly protein PilA